MRDPCGVPDAETAMLLAAAAASGLTPLHKLGPVAAREAYLERVQKTNLAPDPVEHVEDVNVPARDGSLLRARVYRHGSLVQRPLLLYFHGGGFVIGDVDTHDPICRRLAARSGWTVVSVDYRLAPEHRYPHAVHDALAAFDWVWADAGALKADRARIAVAGDSAGATLAAVVAQHARRQGRRLAQQILLYPAVDQGGEYESRNAMREKYLLTREAIDWFAAHYYGHSHPVLEPDASPARAESLTGLAPALVVTAELDPLRDEALHYARQLAAAGVPTRYRCVEGVLHGFLGMARWVSAARRELDDVAADLAADFSGGYAAVTTLQDLAT